MKFSLGRFFEKRSSIENTSIPLSDANLLGILNWGSESLSGVSVTREKALGVPALWAAVNFISSTIASLPLQVFEKTDEGRKLSNKNDLYSILHDAVNEELTSYEWRKTEILNVLLEGRSFTFIERNQANKVMNLWPLDPKNVTVKRENRAKVYIYKEGDKEFRYKASEIIDLKFMPHPDGVSHYSPIVILKNAIGLSIALEDYASKFFQNGGVPRLALTGPLQSPGAAARASDDITEALKNASVNKKNIIALPTGHELKPIGVDPEKSQMEEARRFQLEEIARGYQVPPLFLQELSKMSYSNAEQQDLHVVKHTLTQHIKNFEQEMNLKLFSLKNKKNFIEFNLDGILRGDFSSRMEGYAKAVQNAINTPQEIRRMENWPDRADADVLFIQGATVPLGNQKAGNANG